LVYYTARHKKRVKKRINDLDCSNIIFTKVIIFFGQWREREKWY
jgi:hypothetical protein